MRTGPLARAPHAQLSGDWSQSGRRVKTLCMLINPDVIVNVLTKSERHGRPQHYQ